MFFQSYVENTIAIDRQKNKLQAIRNLTKMLLEMEVLGDPKVSGCCAKVQTNVKRMVEDGKEWSGNAINALIISISAKLLQFLETNKEEKGEGIRENCYQVN